MLLIQVILSSQDSASVSSTCIVVCCRSFLEVALNSVTENSNRLIFFSCTFYGKRCTKHSKRHIGSGIWVKQQREFGSFEIAQGLPASSNNQAVTNSLHFLCLLSIFTESIKHFKTSTAKCKMCLFSNI